MELNTRPPVSRSHCSDSQHVCHEIAEEVRDIAVALYTGRLSPALFEKAVLTLEAAKVKRFGLRLTAERLPDGGSRFLVGHAGTGKACATLDFNPVSDKLEIHDAAG